MRRAARAYLRQLHLNFATQSAIEADDGNTPSCDMNRNAMFSSGHICIYLYLSCLKRECVWVRVCV